MFKPFLSPVEVVVVVFCYMKKETEYISFDFVNYKTNLNYYVLIIGHYVRQDLFREYTRG
jgi:hypothetical protein